MPRDTKVYRKPIKAVAVGEDGVISVQTGDRPDLLVWTVLRGEEVGVPSVGDFVIVGGGQPPRWETAADHDAATEAADRAAQAEAERVAALTPEERQAEIMALYR